MSAIHGLASCRAGAQSFPSRMIYPRLPVGIRTLIGSDDLHRFELTKDRRHSRDTRKKREREPVPGRAGTKELGTRTARKAPDIPSALSPFFELRRSGSGPSFCPAEERRRIGFLAAPPRARLDNITPGPEKGKRRRRGRIGIVAAVPLTIDQNGLCIYSGPVDFFSPRW